MVDRVLELKPPEGDEAEAMIVVQRETRTNTRIHVFDNYIIVFIALSRIDLLIQLVVFNNILPTLFFFYTNQNLSLSLCLSQSLQQASVVSLTWLTAMFSHLRKETVQNQNNACAPNAPANYFHFLYAQLFYQMCCFFLSFVLFFFCVFRQSTVEMKALQ